MKKIVLLLCVIVFGVACESESDTIETKLYTCLMNSLSQEETEKVTTIMSDYEAYLIENNILASSSAESYWNIYKEFAETTLSDFNNEFDFNNKISFLNNKDPEELQGLMDCHFAIFETEAYKQSYMNTIKKEMESMDYKYKENPKVIASMVIKYMTPKDFEEAYNRFNTLLFIERYR